MVQVADKKAQ